MVLSKMKETAEAYLGHKVTHAVVTVPACTYSITTGSFWKVSLNL
jgi:Ethanolamine utilization protein EutJ (predicted chaperonin)